MGNEEECLAIVRSNRMWWMSDRKETKTQSSVSYGKSKERNEIINKFESVSIGLYLKVFALLMMLY